MKLMFWQRIVAVIAFLVLIAAAIWFANRTRQATDAAISVDPAFAEYISAYTSGVVSSTSPLRVVFTRDMVDSSRLGSESDDRLFSFTPSISGKTVWINPRTVEFRPEQRLPAGKSYTATFALFRLNDAVPEALRLFRYAFRTMAQNFEIEVVGMSPYNSTDLSRQKIEGIVRTADYAESVRVEQAMEAAQGGKKLGLTWVHDEDGRSHRFVIEQVARTEARASVVLRVQGRTIGVDRSLETEVGIPPVDRFELMQWRVVQSPTQYVVLQFSDPVQENQNLRGLITLDGLPDLDFAIHGNEVRVYPPVRQNGSRALVLSPGIRNALGKRFDETVRQEVVFEQVQPAVRFVGRGSILPSTDGLVIPFEAVNLNAVDVQIVKIHDDNVLRFIQVNELSGNNELRRVGNRILRKKIALDESGLTDPGKWNRYTLDISQLIQTEPGAIYQVRLSFRKPYSTFGCAGVDSEKVSFETDTPFDDSHEGGYAYDSYVDYYYPPNYEWSQRDNPCHDSYYTSSRSVYRNVLASDLGLIAKRGTAGETYAFVTDLKTAQPVSGAEVAMYSYQLQQMKSARTDQDGKVVFSSTETPFALVAKSGSQRAYLRLVNGEALSVSSFDVSGSEVQKGLKGFLYGERGVWRPGDSLHLTFILKDEYGTLPSHHPVVFELNDPNGQLVQRLVRSSSENGFYRFATATRDDAPTGNWLGRVRAGGAEFSQTLKIETVKPNRLKIDLDFNTERFTSPDIRGTLNVRWLHGAPGRNLRAEFDVLLSSQRTTFAAFPDFHFDDPSRTFTGEAQPLFEGTTNDAGRAEVRATLEMSGRPSGIMQAVFRGKVFEESGNFSIDRFSIPYYPYKSYVGLKVPEGESYSGVLHTDEDHDISVVSVDVDGRPLGRRELNVSLYKLSWRWWWDNTFESLANFVEDNYTTVVREEKITTSDGKASWRFNLEAAEYGRYFLRVCDPVSGHCAGQVLYVDEPGWYSRARGEGGRGGASLLAFTTDKTSYNVGDQVVLTIPAPTGGRALVSIESGSGIVKTFWLETKAGDNRFAFEATPQMAPNVYVHVSLIQPHANTENDMPMRLYGVAPVQVEDPGTRLHPQLEMPDVLTAGERVTIKVLERDNRSMTYTLAIVDEGLLDLTRFQTPDAWSVFNAREALGVRTWDVYDDVMGAFGARLERFISIGGDDQIRPVEMDPVANRFKPVVKFFGPYTLERGSREISFVMPQYIGSVRAMLVAGNGEAFGKAERTALVKKPIMVLTTLPRVLGPQEEVRIPVTVFAGDEALRDVEVSVRVVGPVRLSGPSSKKVTLAPNSDQTIDFNLRVEAATGNARIEVKAVRGSISATDVTEIAVRNPNVPITRVQSVALEAGSSQNVTLTPFGVPGSNSATLEVSALPPLNFATRMRWLLQYPHGCLEQTTSVAFPQLYLDRVMNLSDKEQETVQRNVRAAAERIRRFAHADGGFGYWPGTSEPADSWATSYAGHFLLEAQNNGYYVPDEIMSRWKSFQQSRANAWHNSEGYRNADLLQAYRLYTLALAGSAEFGAMNRLRESSRSTSASWMLASAYAIAGQPEAAKALIHSLPREVEPYRELAYTYGSHLRDRALILETLILLDMRDEAFEVLEEISAALSDDGRWLSTQETAMCLRAVSLFAGKEDRQKEIRFTYAEGRGKSVTVATELAVAQLELDASDKPRELVLDNQSGGLLYARIVTSGTPMRSDEAESRFLSVSVRYTDVSGTSIDPASLQQGQEFIAEVTVRHPGLRGGYENMALTQMFPSGWEINNLRLQDVESLVENSPFRYQDIRDDRVLTYFDLATGESKTFRTMLTAAYGGTYYLPGVSCEAMYDAGIYARTGGRTVTVQSR